MMHFKAVLPDLCVYSDLSEAERKTHPYLICQMESLWSVAAHYDCIIIDESESCLYQLSSSTVTRFEAVTEAFARVVRSSSLCIWADAYLSDRTLVVPASWTPALAPSWCTTSTCQTSGRHTASGGTSRQSQSYSLQQLSLRHRATEMWW